MGDAVLLTVLIQRLAERYRQPVNLLSSGGWTKTLLSPNASVGEIRLVNSRKRPYWLTPSQQEAVAWLKTQPGTVYLCDPDRHSRRLVERAIPKSRIVRVWDRWPGLTAHWADWWESVGTGKPLVVGLGQPRLVIPDAWVADARAWMTARTLREREFVLIQPGNKKTAKRFTWNRENDKFWPLDRWTQTIRAILNSDPRLKVIVCGAPSEAALAERIAASCADARVFSAANELPIQRFAALAQRAHSMISIDTGPAHVAAAVDCPLIVLFGAFGSRRWAPRAPHEKVIALGGVEETNDGHVNRTSADQVIATWRENFLHPHVAQALPHSLERQHVG
jgi:heptosyltransferase III